MRGCRGDPCGPDGNAVESPVSIRGRLILGRSAIKGDTGRWRQRGRYDYALRSRVVGTLPGACCRHRSPRRRRTRRWPTLGTMGLSLWRVGVYRQPGLCRDAPRRTPVVEGLSGTFLCRLGCGVRSRHRHDCDRRSGTGAEFDNYLDQLHFDAFDNRHEHDDHDWDAADGHLDCARIASLRRQHLPTSMGALTRRKAKADGASATQRDANYRPGRTTARGRAPLTGRGRY